jgi:hypothetical protein
MPDGVVISVECSSDQMLMIVELRARRLKYLLNSDRFVARPSFGGLAFSAILIVSSGRRQSGADPGMEPDGSGRSTAFCTFSRAFRQFPEIRAFFSRLLLTELFTSAIISSDKTSDTRSTDPAGPG